MTKRSETVERPSFTNGSQEYHIMDQIDVPSSEDNGNVPIEFSPSPTPQPLAVDPTPDGNVPATPTEPAPQPAATPNEELFELPDGRKVDAATLATEWKQNFLPDYTRKSQALAAQKQGSQQPPAINNEPSKAPTNKYADPTYVPQSWEEVIQVAEERALERFNAQQEGEAQRIAAIENHVTAQLQELKTVDPSLNETALFQHATKYGFSDLKAAHANMKDMSAMVRNVQQQTAANIQKRANEPVATTPGQANGTQPNPADFATARDFMRSLK